MLTKSSLFKTKLSNINTLLLYLYFGLPVVVGSHLDSVVCFALCLTPTEIKIHFMEL
jgi:hypothetical protein